MRANGAAETARVQPKDKVNNELTMQRKSGRGGVARIRHKPSLATTPLQADTANDYCNNSVHEEVVKAACVPTKKRDAE